MSNETFTCEVQLHDGRKPVGTAVYARKDPLHAEMKMVQTVPNFSAEFAGRSLDEVAREMESFEQSYHAVVIAHLRATLHRILGSPGSATLDLVCDEDWQLQRKFAIDLLQNEVKISGLKIDTTQRGELPDPTIDNATVAETFCNQIAAAREKMLAQFYENMRKAPGKAQACN